MEHIPPVTICGIQHFSLFNGPGIRTTVFFKGCPLRCAWCCNPESQKQDLCVAFDKYACIGIQECGICMNQCPSNAIYTIPDANIGFARDICLHCGHCVNICPSNAFFMDGEIVEIDAIMQRISADIEYIREEGGITLSGGEPLMRPQVAAEILRRCHSKGLHTAIETSGFFDLDNAYVQSALQNTDILYYDIKHLDPIKHKQGTELDNTRILQNLQRIGREYTNLSIIVRTAIIPDFNDTVEEFLAIVRFVKSIHGVQSHEIIPFNTMCSDKYMQLGLPVPYVLQYKVDQVFLNQCVSIGEAEGVHVTILS